MNTEQTFEKLSQTVTIAKEKFTDVGIKSKIEFAYMNNWMQAVDSLEKARYVTISLVLYTDEISEGDEYCLSLGAEIKKNNIPEEIIEKDIKSFNQIIDETYDRLVKAEDKTKEISALANEASAEFDKLVLDVKKAEKKQRITSLIGLAIVIGIFAILILIMFLV